MSTSMFVRVATVASLAALAGCVGPEIAHPAPIPHARAALPVALVVDDLTVPTLMLDDGNEASVARRGLFVDAVNDALDRGLSGEARRVVPELEVTRRPSSLPAVEVQYRVASYEEQIDPYPPEAIAMLAGALPTFGLSAFPVGQVHRGRTHAAYVEMRVYDVRSAPFGTRTDAASDESHDGYALATAPLVFRRRYWIEMHTTTSVVALPSGLNEDRFLRTEGNELGHRIVDASLDDLTHAIERVLDTDPIGPAAAPVPTPPPIPMST